MIVVPNDVQADLVAGRAQVRFWWRIDTDPVTAIWTGATPISYGGLTWEPLPTAAPPKFGQMGSDLAVRSTVVEIPAPLGLGDELFDTVDLGLSTVRTGYWIWSPGAGVRFSRQMHRGRVDNLEMTESTQDVAWLRITSTGRVADARRDGGRIASDSDQRRRDANDGFFKRTASMQDVEIIIGGRGPAPAGGGGGGLVSNVTNRAAQR